MNSEQILLVVAALGVVTFSVLTTVGAKKKRRTPDPSPAGSRAARGTPRPNRATRRKRR